MLVVIGRHFVSLNVHRSTEDYSEMPYGFFSLQPGLRMYGSSLHPVAVYSWYFAYCESSECSHYQGYLQLHSFFL